MIRHKQSLKTLKKSFNNKIFALTLYFFCDILYNIVTNIIVRKMCSMSNQICMGSGHGLDWDMTGREKYVQYGSGT